MSEMRQLLPLPWLVAVALLAFACIKLPLRLRELNEPPTVQKDAKTSAEELFNSLAERGDIRLAKEGSLRLTEPAEGGDDALLDKYAGSKAGEAVRNAILYWNEQHRLAAIRDNRLGDAGLPYIPLGERKSGWQATLSLNGATFPLKTQDRVSTALGAVAWPLRLGMSDWLAAPVGGGIGTVTFTAEVTEPAGLGRAWPSKLGIDVVGRVVDVRLNGRPARERDPQAGGLKEGEYRNERRCSSASGARLPPVCPKDATPDLAHLDVSLPTDVRKVELDVAPIDLPPLGTPDRLEGSPITLADKPKDGESCPEKQPRCRPRWSIDGAVPTAVARRARAPTHVRSWDGKDLLVSLPPAEAGTVPKIEPTSLARNLGLLPVLGMGPNDWGGLAGWLAWRRRGDEPLDVRLTIRSDWQKIAQDLLESCADKLAEGHESFKNIDKSKNCDGMPTRKPQSTERRAAIVLMDAGTGDILAAATTPMMPTSLNEWDLQASEAWSAATAPLAARAWRGGDRHNAPGSVWKLLTAVALIDTASSDGSGIPSDIRNFADQAVRGYSDQDLEFGFGAKNYDGKWATPYFVFPPEYLSTELRKKAYIEDIKARNNGSLKTYEYTRLGPIKNASADEGLGYGLLSTSDYRNKKNELITGSKCLDISVSSRLGLCEALITSVNVWFVHAILETDGRRLSSSSDKNPAVLAIQEAAKRLLGSDDYQDATGTDLLASLVCADQPELCIGGRPPPAGGRGGRLRAEQSSMTINDSSAKSGLPRFKLAQNAFGQGVRVTPLQIAALYGALSRRQAVEPRLVASFGLPEQLVPQTGGGPQPGRPLFATPAGDAYWEYLERGLAGVAKASGGTADDAMRGSFLVADATPRLLSKTGTANIGTEDPNETEPYYTAWYAGLLKAKPGSGDQDLAFACMVTHSAKFGGEVCAPIMRRLLERIASR